MFPRRLVYVQYTCIEGTQDVVGTYPQTDRSFAGDFLSYNPNERFVPGTSFYVISHFNGRY